MRTMNRALGFLLLLVLQSGAFPIYLSVTPDGSSYTFKWDPDTTCNTITINVNDFPFKTVPMSPGECTGPIPGDKLVYALKGGKTLQVDVDVKCSSNPSLGSLAHNTFSLSLTNDNDLPVVVIPGSSDQAASTSTSTTSTPTNTHTSSTQNESPSSSTPTTTDSSPSPSTSTTSSISGHPTWLHSQSSSSSIQSNSSVTAPAAADSSSTPSPSSSSGSAITSSNSGKKSNNVGAIAGGVIGGVIGLLLLLALILSLLKRRRRRRYEDEALATSDVFDPRRKTIQRAWDDQMGYAMGQAEEKTRAVTATPDMALGRFNDSQPSHKGLLENIDEHGYPMDKTPSRWGTPDMEVPSYRRESFQSEDGVSSLYHPDHNTEEATTPRWDPNRFVRSPSPH